MSSDSVTIYKPLIEVVTFSKEKYYSDLSLEAFSELIADNKFIYLSFSQRGLNVASVESFGPARQSEIMFEHTILSLDPGSKIKVRELANGWIKDNPTKELTEGRLRNMIEKVKNS